MQFANVTSIIQLNGSGGKDVCCRQYPLISGLVSSVSFFKFQTQYLESYYYLVGISFSIPINFQSQILEVLIVLKIELHACIDCSNCNFDPIGLFIYFFGRKDLHKIKRKGYKRKGSLLHIGLFDRKLLFFIKIQNDEASCLHLFSCFHVNHLIKKNHAGGPTRLY